MKLKLKSINELGFDHVFMAVAFVVVIGVAGVGLLISSNAEPWKGLLEVDANGSGYCLTAAGKTTGSAVELEPCSSTVNNAQIWTLNDLNVTKLTSGKTVQLFNLQSSIASNECLDNWGQSKVKTYPAKLYPCTTGGKGVTWLWAAQLANLGLSTHQLDSLGSNTKHTELCLDDKGASHAANTPVGLYKCKTSGQANQEWFEHSAPTTTSPTPNPAPGTSKTAPGSSTSTGTGSSGTSTTTATTTTTTSCSGAPSASSLTADPTTTQLEGTEAVDWAEAALCQIGAPLTTANIQTITTWMLNEGSPHCGNNPINLIVTESGSTTCTAMAGAASIGLQNYATPAGWVLGFQKEIEDQYYPQLLSDFKSGAGFLNSTNSTVESELRFYSGAGYDGQSGYDSIPAAYLNGKLGAD